MTVHDDDRCDCGGTLQFDDAEGIAHCPDCGSHERYIPKTIRCEHDWQVEGINLRRDSTGVLECSKCGARQEDVVLTDDQIWRFIGDHVIG